MQHDQHPQSQQFYPVRRFFASSSSIQWVRDRSIYLKKPLCIALRRHPPYGGDCYCLDTFRAGDLEGAANVNIITCTRLKGLIDGTDGLRSHASVPLYAHGKRLGVLNVVSSDWRELAAEDLRLLYTVGDLVGIAIERARLFAASTQIGALEERNRLAREIHDTLMQGLTGIIMQLETADAFLEGAQPDRGRETLQQAIALTRSNLEEARRSVLDLRAAPLEGRSLDQALAALIRDWRTEAKVKITFETSGSGRCLRASKQACIVLRRKR
jgi:two-component system NarL family sensor kinase